MTKIGGFKSAKSSEVFLSIFCLVQMVIIVVLAWRTITLSQELLRLDTALKNLEILQEQSNLLDENADWEKLLESSESATSTSSVILDITPTLVQ